MTHSETIRREFAKQSSHFERADLNLSSKDYLAWMVEILPLRSDFHVLDVAAGTGHLSRAIAPHVKQIVAIDLTPEMLERAREESHKSKLNNISFEEGDAASLRYQAATFDMVVSRLAIHHFEDPLIQLREMVRVCKSDHIVGVIDLLSPSEEHLIGPYNHLERLRDPSHTFALTKDQLINAMGMAGVVINRFDERDIEVDFERWVEMTDTDRRIVKTIRSELEQELRGGRQTGMRPYVKDGRLQFLQVWSVVMAVKSPNKLNPGDARQGA